MSDSIFSLNYLALCKSSPDFAAKITKYENAKEYSIQIDEGKETTLLIDGRQLTSHHDRMGAAKYQCQKLDIKKPICIYGFGLGDNVKYLLNKNPKADIRVFILNPALFLKLLSIDDELHTLFKANVNFSLPDDNTCIYSNSIIMQSELLIDSKTFNNLKSRLINFLDNNFANDYFNKTTKKLFDKNIKDNFELLKNEKALTQEILDKYPKEIMITASGPSLEDNIETVRELHNCGVLLIAADTSLTTLNAEKIIPDVIVTTDANVYVALKDRIFKDLGLYKNTTLFFSAHSEKGLIEKYPGPKFFIYQKRDLEQLPYLTKDNADFISYGGSVLNESVAIAIKSKAKTIKLFGCDFAFKGDRTHTGDIADKAMSTYDKELYVECNDGLMQKTIRVFNLYREYLEDEISKHKDIRFENYSKTGAKIKGAILV